eukprot:2946133-Amphidinium_carterae.1
MVCSTLRVFQDCADRAGLCNQESNSAQHWRTGLDPKPQVGRRCEVTMSTQSRTKRTSSSLTQI